MDTQYKISKLNSRIKKAVQQYKIHGNSKNFHKVESLVRELTVLKLTISGCTVAR